MGRLGLLERGYKFDFSRLTLLYSCLLDVCSHYHVVLSHQGLPGPQGANGFPGPKGPPVRTRYLLSYL